MTKPMGFHGFTRFVYPLIFSLLAVIAIVAIPLLSAVPVFATWGPDVRLTNNPAISQNPHVAISGNNVHVVWCDGRDGSATVYYKRSTDGGTTWGADTRLSNLSVIGPSGSSRPAIAVSMNTVHVVWVDNRDGNDEIYYKRSTDGGTTWGADTRLTNDAATSDTPRIAVSGNNLHIVWVDNRGGNLEIYYKRSADGGTTWGADTRLTNDPAFSTEPIVAVSGNNIHVVWRDTRDSDTNEVYYKKSDDGGTTWGPDTSLTNSPTVASFPAIAVSGTIVHVVWGDWRNGNDEIYYKRSTNSGTTWEADTRLTNDPSFSVSPAIAVSGNNVQVVWLDLRGGPFEIFYKHSTYGGITWNADAALTNGHDPAYSTQPSYPDVAVSGNIVHVVWYDNRDGNTEIYYRKFTAAPAISSIDPDHGTQGQTLNDVNIIGANFTGTTKVNFGNGIVVKSFHVIGDARISVNITIDEAATPGIRSVSVTAPGGPLQIGINNHFTVIPKTKTSQSASIATSLQGTVQLSSISVKSASLSTTKVAPGSPVTVTADVVNTGTVNGASSIKVYVNGELENSQGVSVNSGSSTPVTFTISRNEPGTYSVYVGGTQAGSFTVDQFADPNIILYLSGALLIFAFVIGLLFILRRRQAGR